MVRKAGHKALLAIVPQLTEAHYGMVSTWTVRELCSAVNNYAPVPVVLIEAIGRVSGGAAIPAMRRLAAMDWHADVREAAERVLPILLARQQQERAAELLLRSADPIADDAVLLRAAANATAVEPALLLRAEEPPG